jgi:hypothetical protein
MTQVRVAITMNYVTKTNACNDDIGAAVQAVYDSKITACSISPAISYDDDSLFTSKQRCEGFIGICGQWLFYTRGNRTWYAKRIGSEDTISNLADREQSMEAQRELRFFESDRSAMRPAAKKSVETVTEAAPAPVPRAIPVAGPPPPSAPPPRRFEPTISRPINFPSESIWPVVIGIVIVVCMCLFFGFVGRSSAASSSQMDLMVMLHNQHQAMRDDRAIEMKLQQQRWEREQREREQEREQQRKQRETELELRRQQDKADREERQASNTLTTFMQMLSLGGDRPDYFLGGPAAGPAAVGHVRPSRASNPHEVAVIQHAPPRSMMDTIVYGVVIGLGVLFALWKCSQCMCPDVRAEEYMEEEPRYEDAPRAQNYQQYERVYQQPRGYNYDPYDRTFPRLKND